MIHERDETALEHTRLLLTHAERERERAGCELLQARGEAAAAREDAAAARSEARTDLVRLRAELKKEFSPRIERLRVQPAAGTPAAAGPQRWRWWWALRLALVLVMLRWRALRRLAARWWYEHGRWWVAGVGVPSID
jgi:hypothetical protein